MALMGRAFSQAQKFGVEIAIPDEAVKLECGNDPCHLSSPTGERIQARGVVLATGARYRRLGVDRLDEFEGRRSIIGPRRWKPILRRQDVALVGGGNSAGQATVFLASSGEARDARRAPAAGATMSQYLIERIESLPNVDVVIGCEICVLEGAPGAFKAVN